MSQDGTPETEGSADVPPADEHAEDISGVDNWLEEGGPLEPQDLVEVEGAAASSAPAGGPEEAGEGGDELVLARIALEERTLDLQRLQAEYLNYKRRVERDRDLVKQNSTYAVLVPIVEVLDTIDRARDSARSTGSEIDDGLRTVADQLERVVSSLGLVKFGEPGDAFDPTVHEALSHIGEDPDVEVTTCKVIAKAGYKIGDRVVRAAQVLVVDPAGQ